MIEDELGTIDLRKEILVELIIDFNCHLLFAEESIGGKLHEMSGRTKIDGPGLSKSNVIAARKKSSTMFSLADTVEEYLQRKVT